MDTSLHIALCDSNPGDRRHMERLLERESDKRINTTGGFYVDTFGSIEAILKAALVYDVYFIDSDIPLSDSYTIALAIRKKGIITPIVFCSSNVDYRTYEPLENTLFIDKPIDTGELAGLLDGIIEKKKEEFIPTIELRSNYEAYYVTEPDVLYFEGGGYSLTVYFKDGSSRQATTTLEILREDLSNYDSFFWVNKKTILNVRYIESFHFYGVIMTNGKRIKVARSVMKALKNRKAALGC